MTSSKSSSWQFDGESRSCARSGRWTSTVRSVPTSELAPSAYAVTVLIARVSFRDSIDRRGDADEGAADDEDDDQERPDELQVAVVTDLREREAAHDHRRRRCHEIHEARSGLEGRDDDRARDARKVGQRREDGHDEGGMPRRRGNEERDRDV